MNPLSLILASAMGAGAYVGVSGASGPFFRPLDEPAPTSRLSEESKRRIEAAEAKRERRRARRLELAAEARSLAICDVACSVELARRARSMDPRPNYYDLSEQIVGDLLADHRWTAARISRDPAAAVRAWGAK